VRRFGIPFETLWISARICRFPLAIG